jgi:N6-adenosine-specific RNA methylase IME4
MKYAAIYADPPWRFRNWSPAGERKNPEIHYPCMTVDRIAALPVADLALPDAALFLWVTGPFLMAGELNRLSGSAPPARIARGWGFTHYCGLAFTWVKRNPESGKYAYGPGYWTRHNAEFVLMFKRGTPKRLACDVPELVIAPRGPHSEKPEDVAQRIERLVAGPYVELFARRERAGWTCLGNELTGRDLADDIRRLADQPSLALEGACV